MERDIRRQVGCRCRIYHRDRKTPRHSTRTTGRGAGWYLASDDYGTMRAFSFSSLSCRIPIRIPDYRFVVLGAGVALPSRSSVSLGRYEGRGGSPFPVPSPRPVFRCSACPTRQSIRRTARPCPAWWRRYPDACGNRLRARNHGRRAGRRYRPRGRSRYYGSHRKCRSSLRRCRRRR